MDHFDDFSIDWQIRHLLFCTIRRHVEHCKMLRSRRFSHFLFPLCALDISETRYLRLHSWSWWSRFSFLKLRPIIGLAHAGRQFISMQPAQEARARRARVPCCAGITALTKRHGWCFVEVERSGNSRTVPCSLCFFFMEPTFLVSADPRSWTQIVYHELSINIRPYSPQYHVLISTIS